MDVAWCWTLVPRVNAPFGCLPEQMVWVTSEDKGACVPGCWCAACWSGGGEGGWLCPGLTHGSLHAAQETTEDFLKEHSDFSGVNPGALGVWKNRPYCLSPKFWAFFLHWTMTVF